MRSRPIRKLLLIALAMGIATSLLAAVLPARDAARVDPVLALQKGKAQMFSEAENRMRKCSRRMLAGSHRCCADLSPACISASMSAFGLTIVAAFLLAPTLGPLLVKTAAACACVRVSGGRRARGG